MFPEDISKKSKKCWDYEVTVDEKRIIFQSICWNIRWSSN